MGVLQLSRLTSVETITRHAFFQEGHTTRFTQPEIHSTCPKRNQTTRLWVPGENRKRRHRTMPTRSVKEHQAEHQAEVLLSHRVNAGEVQAVEVLLA